MAVGEISSSAFEFYEGLRVLISGGFAVGLYAGATTTFGIGADVSTNALAAVVAALFSGLLLLFLDLPAKAAVFSYEAPVSKLEEWDDIKPSAGALLTVYYEILDSEVPVRLRNSVYYLGSIYRIGFEAVYFSSAALGVLIVAVCFPSVGMTRHGTDTSHLRWLLGLGALLHGFVGLAAVWARYREHVRKRRPAGQRLLGDLRTEIPASDRVVMVASLVATIWFAAGGPHWIGAVGVTLMAVLWAVRYFVGVRVQAETAADEPTTQAGAKRDARLKRQNLHGVSAAVLFAFAAVSLLAAGASRATSDSPLSMSAATAWLAVTLVAAVLIGVRSHERRLLGSYLTQYAWLTRNKDSLVKKGYFVRSESSA